MPLVWRHYFHHHGEKRWLSQVVFVKKSPSQLKVKVTGGKEIFAKNPWKMSFHCSVQRRLSKFGRQSALIVRAEPQCRCPWWLMKDFRCDHCLRCAPVIFLPMWTRSFFLVCRNSASLKWDSLHPASTKTHDYVICPATLEIRYFRVFGRRIFCQGAAKWSVVPRQ